MYTVTLTHTHAHTLSHNVDSHIVHVCTCREIWEKRGWKEIRDRQDHLTVSIDHLTISIDHMTEVYIT